MTLPATDISFADIRDAIGATTLSLDDPNVRRLNAQKQGVGKIYADLWEKMGLPRTNSLGEYRNVLCTANIGKEPARNLDATPRKDRVQLIKYDPRGIMEWLSYIDRYDQQLLHVDGPVVKVKNNYSYDCGGSLAINSYAEPGAYQFRGVIGSEGGTDKRYMIDIYGWTNGWRSGSSQTLLSVDKNKNMNIHNFNVNSGYQWITVNLGIYVRNQTNFSNGTWFVDEMEYDVAQYYGGWDCLNVIRTS